MKNEPTIRKGMIMTKATTLAVLALACLMAMPSVARARYSDGMNMYEYVRGNPSGSVDSTGKAAERAPQPELTSLWHMRGWPTSEATKNGKKPYKHTIVSFGGSPDGAGADFGPEKPYQENLLKKCPAFVGCPGEATAPAIFIPLKPLELTQAIQLRRKMGKNDYLPPWQIQPDGTRIPCRCATDEEIKYCMVIVSDVWDKMTFDPVFRNCMHFAYDAEKTCCIKNAQFPLFFWSPDF